MGAPTIVAFALLGVAVAALTAQLVVCASLHRRMARKVIELEQDLFDARRRERNAIRQRDAARYRASRRMEATDMAMDAFSVGWNVAHGDPDAIGLVGVEKGSD